MADSPGGVYTKKVMKRFTNPKFAGEIKNADGIGQVGNMRCGDVLRVYIKVDKNKIKDIKFKTFGCVAAIAASDALCEMAKGKTLAEAMKITDKQIAEFVGGLPCIKHHCSVLGSEALKKAIEDYKKKNSKKK
ncbi:MAG: iron-sulfur cluster assembly scaffold protein [Nanoarchaeota archaeon]